MSELQRLKSLLPPENESWVFVEAAAAIDPPLITLEEIGRDEVEIQIDLDKWDNFAIDHRNLLFWHEVGKIQNDTIPRDGLGNGSSCYRARRGNRRIMGTRWSTFITSSWFIKFCRI